MAIYIGGKKWKLRINGVALNINIPTSIPITNGIVLLSSDGFMLKDVNNLYMTATDIDDYENKLLSFDDYILKDLNELYLTTKGE